MQRIPAKHRALRRSAVELEEQKRQLGGLLGSLLDPILGGPTTAPSDPQPSPEPSPSPTSAPDPSSSPSPTPRTSPSPSPSPTSATDGSTPVSGGGGGGIIPATPVSSSREGSGVTPSASPSVNSPAPTGSPSSSSNGGGNYLGTGSSSSSPAPINVAPTPNTSVLVGTSSPAGVATGVPFTPSQPPQEISGSNTEGLAPSATLTSSGAVSNSSHLSAGAIAAIVIVCLISLVAIIILIARRRSIARRAEIRQQWRFGHGRSSGSFSFVSNTRDPSALSGAAAGSRNSARSSFATNFDQGLMFRIDSPMGSGSLGITPEFPPMAEVRERNSVLISTGGEVARRESMNSMLSNGSDHGGQYLAVATASKTDPASPITVRPFSPSESFSFPKPPDCPQSAVSSADSFFLAAGQAAVSSQSSATTLVHINSPPRALTSDQLPPTSPVVPPSSPSPVIPKSLTPKLFIANPDPFVDPAPAQPEFSDVEVIRRPFTPTLDDELAVIPGDRVRVLQVFDDGWAFVDRMASAQYERNEKGLIPVDCLREAGQALPTFLAQKRVSSYGTTDVTATATAY